MQVQLQLELGQSKSREIHFNDAKWHVFAPSHLHHCFGGKGLIVPFYSVQDCSLERSSKDHFLVQ